jgi:hypothetical protein
MQTQPQNCYVIYENEKEESSGRKPVLCSSFSLWKTISEAYVFLPFLLAMMTTVSVMLMIDDDDDGDD